MLTYFLQIWEVWFILLGFPDLLWSLLAKSHLNVDPNSYLVWRLFHTLLSTMADSPSWDAQYMISKFSQVYFPLVENMIRRDTLDFICYSYTMGIMPIQRQFVAFILLSGPERFQSKLEKDLNCEAWSAIGRWDARLGIESVNVMDRSLK